MLSFRFTHLCRTLSRRFGVSAMTELFYVSEEFSPTRLHVNFTYREPVLSFERVFHMHRSPDESIGVFAKRITMGIEGKLTKLFHKRRKKNPGLISDDMCSPSVTIWLDGDQVSPDSLCGSILIASGERVSIRVGSTMFKVCVNLPEVKKLKLPSRPMDGFLVYPTDVSLDHASMDESQFVWQRGLPAVSNDNTAEVAATNQAEWLDVGEGRMYRTGVEDRGCFLRLQCTPRRAGRQGRPATTVCGPVAAAPGPCPLERRHELTGAPLPADCLRVVSYNVLADMYADSDYSRTVLYPYCPPHALHIDYRRQLLVRELSGYHADVVCLQEVDRHVFDCDLLPTMSAAGLGGAHFADKAGHIREGLVCLWRTDKLRLVESQRVLLADLIHNDPLFADVVAACGERDELATKVAKMAQALQVCVLESVAGSATGRRLLVANTHLFSKPDADHIRALQIGVCMRFLERKLHALRAVGRVGDGGDGADNSQAHLLFCGDFNSCPEFSVCRLMRSGRLPSDLADFSCKENEEVRGVSFEHGLTMESACGFPAYTNHVSSFSGCLDYIFYETSGLRVLRALPMPDDQEVTRHTALPSIVFPSDHMSLVAELAWRGSSNASGVADR